MTTYEYVGRLWNGVESKLTTFNSGNYALYDLDASHCVIISTNTPAETAGAITAAEAWFTIYNPNGPLYDEISVKWKFATFSKSGNVFTQRDIQATWGESVIDNPMAVAYYHVNPDVTGVDIDIKVGDYIGIVLERQESDTHIYPEFCGVDAGNDVYVSEGSTSPYTCSIAQDINGDITEAFVYGINSIPDGDLPTPNFYGEPVPNACQTYTTTIEAPGWYNGYAYLGLTDVNASPRYITVNLKLPWLQEIFGYDMDEGETYTFRNPIDQSECYSITFNSIFWFSGYEGVSSLTECWFYQTANNERWVSMAGSDSNTGMHSTLPFATVTKAITDISDGGLIHIQEGFYGNETGISSITKQLLLSPENGAFARESCSVTLSEQAFSSTVYGITTDSGTAGGYSSPFIKILSSYPIPAGGGIVTMVRARCSGTGAINVIILRPQGSGYYVVYNEAFQYQTDRDGISVSTMDVLVEEGDLVGLYFTVDGWLEYVNDSNYADDWDVTTVPAAGSVTYAINLVQTSSLICIEYTLVTL